MSTQTRALRILVAWMPLFVGLLPAAAQAQDAGDGDYPSTVIEVRFEGLEHVREQVARSLIGTRVGEEYSEQQILSDRQQLLASRRFSSVVVTRTQTTEGVIVTYQVRERPLVTAVRLEGNKVFSDEELSRELSFGVNSPLNVFEAEAGRQAILAKYQSRGYAQAEVELDREALDDQRVVYRITEGPQVRVRKLRFEGNEYFSNWRLKRATESSQRLWPFIDGFLDIEQVQRDLTSIRNLYVSEGFLDAEVDRLLEYSPDKRSARLTFVIDEGPRYRVNRLIFRGNTVFADEELAGRLDLGRGEFYVAETVRRDAGRLEDTYGQLGYINASVSERKQFLDPTGELPDWATELEDEQVGLLNVVFELEEEDQYRVGKIDIRGNHTTQDRVIRRDLRFYPEQLFNAVAVEKSRRDLQETWLFEDVEINPVGDEPGVRDALVQVSEGRTAEFLIGVGVSTNSGLLGTISLTERNFDILNWPTSWDELTSGRAWRGAGQTFRIVAEPGTELNRFHVEWTEPAIFDGPYSLTTKAFLFDRVREDYDEQRYGGVVSVGRLFENRWYGEVATRVEGIELSNFYTNAPPEIRQLDGTTGLVGVKGSLVRDRTDSRWTPTTGDRLRLSYEQVMGDYTFGEANVEYRRYWPVYQDALDRKHVIATRFGIGHIFGDAPVFERFFGGGTGSIRGFRHRGVGPRAEPPYDRNPIGGDFELLASAEYNFPIVGEELRGVVFLDTGTVERDFEITTYRASIGAGLRWVVPLMGPVPMSLDFGIPINKDSDDETQLVSFTLGWTL
ncbi:MAG: outer membrane protein assembly factor BamA [Phycisphaerae bacterium]